MLHLRHHLLVHLQALMLLVLVHHVGILALSAEAHLASQVGALACEIVLRFYGFALMAELVLALTDTHVLMPSTQLYLLETEDTVLSLVIVSSYFLDPLVFSLLCWRLLRLLIFLELDMHDPLQCLETLVFFFRNVHNFHLRVVGFHRWVFFWVFALQGWPL